ncbi:MAG TPA: hypothetical protein VKB51_05440 [bacterium]|nr:hypothetical protein [bacterium]
MKRSEDCILTSHTGSLPRPKALVDLFARRAHGEAIDEAALEAEIEAATRWVVPKQIEAGIDIPNNGEQPRESFFLYAQRRMSGFGPGGSRRGPRDVERYPGYLAMRQRILQSQQAVSSFEVPSVVGPVRYLDPAAIERECQDFRRVLDEAAPGVVDAFVTAPSPGIIAAAVPDQHYGDQEAYIGALAEALRTEYEAIARHGFVLQIDCPDLALERHVSYAERPLADFLAFVERVIAAINHALANVPREQVRLHVCWGNYEGPHDLDVALEEILSRVLQANVGAIMLPFANPRHAHETRLFSGDRLAPDQLLVAGVIDTTTNYVEHPEVVAQRIERAVEAVGDPRRVIAGTDCGFDTSAGMGRVAEDVVWAKLAALAAGAQLASERLF